MVRFKLKHKWRGYLQDLNNIDDVTFQSSEAKTYTLSEATDFIDSRSETARWYWSLERVS